MRVAKYKPLTMIKVLRKHKGLTQKELAAKSDVVVLTIQNLEKGWTNPYDTKYSTLLKIAEALKVKVEDLFNDL